MPAAQIFTTDECAWKHTKLVCLGRTITGAKGFSFEKSIEKELLFASGDKAIDIQEGNQSVSGNITLLKYEVDMLNEAARLAGYTDILEVPHTLINIVCVFKKTLTSPSRTIIVPSLAFTSMGVAMQQNAKEAPITLPFISAGMTLT
jgi:hypothetical protein